VNDPACYRHYHECQQAPEGSHSRCPPGAAVAGGLTFREQAIFLGFHVGNESANFAHQSSPVAGGYELIGRSKALFAPEGDKLMHESQLLLHKGAKLFHVALLAGIVRGQGLKAAEMIPGLRTPSLLLTYEAFVSSGHVAPRIRLHGPNRGGRPLQLRQDGIGVCHPTVRLNQTLDGSVLDQTSR